MSHDLGIGICAPGISGHLRSVRCDGMRRRKDSTTGRIGGLRIRRRGKSLCLLAVCQYNATAERDTRIYGISLSKTQNSCPLPPLMEWTINLNVQTDNVPYVKRLRHCSGNFPKWLKSLRSSETARETICKPKTGRSLSASANHPANKAIIHGQCQLRCESRPFL